MYCVLWRFDKWYIIACGDPIMVWFLIIDFPQNICDDVYYIICFLYRNYASLHCSMLSTRCIKATVPSIR